MVPLPPIGGMAKLTIGIGNQRLLLDPVWKIYRVQFTDRYTTKVVTISAGSISRSFAKRNAFSDSLPAKMPADSQQRC